MIDFSTPYKRNDFLVFLENFLPDDFTEVEEKYDDLNFSTRYTVNATKLGTCGSLELDVFEITHTSSHDARVGIAQDAFRLMLHKSYNNRALVIFKQEGSRQYRFSLLQIEASQADYSSRITRSFSNPRRYSFLMGEGAHVKTPNQFLLEKGKLMLKDGSYFNDLQERFSVEVLTKLFYKELSDWYFWALKQVKFPSEPTLIQATALGKNHEDLVKEHNATNVIRMLTRLLFVWFIKQKGLIPEELFDENELENNILTELNPIKQTGMFTHTGKDSVYYKAILQNLFFASLNCPIKPQSDDEDKRERGFRREANYGDDFGNDWLFRYKKYFQKEYQDGKFVELINSKVPFLNGGLFECLDDKHNKIFIDGFSDNLPKTERLLVPDYIFFGRDENVDLSDDYGDTSPQFKQASVKGLINILKTYNFTVEENTPAEIEVALDPELLGKVFENLLASFNPETKTTARKQTGSFYTPREIVNYMVDESLIAYFKGKTEIEEEKIRTLFQYTDEEHKLTSTQVEELVNALYECKILDPACGSGAFPMGILQKLVHILQKADPDNKNWEKVQKEKAEIELQRALDIDDKKDRENRLMEISNAFDVTKNTPDYARKLYLIENCIYGVDIQPIATQISKLRFFISLVVDQKNNTNDENFGIIPLPNLETKFVTANTLIGINRPTGQLSLSNTDEIKKLQEELRVCRHKIFSAKTKKTKQKWRVLDKEKRLAIANELKVNGWNNTDADNLAGWDPYNQNASSPFFDPEWMFGLQRENGGLNSAGDAGFFDVVIANPPYINIKKQDTETKNTLQLYKYSKGADIYVGFLERGYNLLRSNAIICYIIPNKFFGASYGKKIRKYIQDQKKILSIWDPKDEKVFESASITTIVYLSANEIQNDDDVLIKYEDNVRLVNSVFDDNGKIQLETSDDEKEFLNNIISNFKPLTAFATIRTGIMGFEYWKMQDIISSDGIINEKNVPIYTNGNLRRYKDNWDDTEISLYKSKYFSPTIQLNNNYLNNNTIELFKTYPKIIVRGVSKEVAGIIDFRGAGLLVAVHSICPINIEIYTLLGIINSKFINWYHLKTYYSQRIPQGSLKYPIEFFNSIPIPDISANLGMRLKNEVEKLFNNINSLNEIEIKQSNLLIDILVYKLYNLTYDEVKVIDPEFQLSETEYNAFTGSF